MFRCALEVLRDVTGPLTTREIAEQMLARKGVTDAPQKGVRDLAGGVQSSLRNHDGKSVETVGEGMPVRWVLKNP